MDHLRHVPGQALTTAVVVPWDPATTCEWRIRWLPQVLAYWDEHGFAVTLGLGKEGMARRDGVERSAADVILMCDADSVIGVDQARASLRLAGRVPGLVVPHDRYVYLDQATSEALTVREVGRTIASNGNRWPLTTGLEFTGAEGVGGPVAFSRETYDRAGGYDSKIVHGYDSAFALACGILAGEQRRLTGDYVHLWHPRPETLLDTWAALRHYHDAAESGSDAMRALVAERAA